MGEITTFEKFQAHRDRRRFESPFEKHLTERVEMLNRFYASPVIDVMVEEAQKLVPGVSLTIADTSQIRTERDLAFNSQFAAHMIWDVQDGIKGWNNCATRGRTAFSLSAKPMSDYIGEECWVSILGVSHDRKDVKGLRRLFVDVIKASPRVALLPASVDGSVGRIVLFQG